MKITQVDDFRVKRDELKTHVDDQVGFSSQPSEHPPFPPPVAMKGSVTVYHKCHKPSRIYLGHKGRIGIVLRPKQVDNKINMSRF